MEIEQVWNALEKTIADLEAGRGDWELNCQAAQAGIELLFEYEPAVILDCFKRSTLPEKALVTWVIFEGCKMDELDLAKLQALRDEWDRMEAPAQGPINLPPIARPKVKSAPMKI
jgi:hypothetical protein